MDYIIYYTKSHDRTDSSINIPYNTKISQEL